jgi:predicted metal-dependent hydrolase
MAQAWLQGRARNWFQDRLNHFLRKTGLSITKWRLSSAGTRWGSCSSDGNIMLNWRLIHFSPMVIDYVIAHELAHLREMNHSRDFWNEVEQLYPDYLSAKQILKQFSPDGVPEL